MKFPKKCLIIQRIHDAGLNALVEGGVTPVLCPAPDMASVAAHVGDCDAAITRDAGFSAAALDAAPRLRGIIVHGSGYDVVDVAAATARGVAVCNTPGVNAQSVVELTLGLAFAAARRLTAADRAVWGGDAGFRESAPFTELHGKAALIIGWGAIGARVGAALRAALGMTILTPHRPGSPPPDGVDAVVPLEDGLARAALISLHAPLTAETRGLIGASALGAIAPGAGAILVNTSRAGLVDEAALADALATGRIAAAGLDVASPDVARGPLAAFTDRVILSPHVGGTTEEARRRVSLAAAGHVLTLLHGGRPSTLLNPETLEIPA
ncbi:3-phosphoglycerate dehydrogenase [Roseospira marina]|uniref:3-phosphoglycerate dehydrogenase n=1 Tax=Roseospira marina TaxID=140057 RepID=A0A5M6IJ06_9PROT|nr:3-phosphoglycerate dehydrogenase [Roseospira marina]